MEGGNLLTRWTHTVDEDSDYSLQFYYDRLGYSIPTLALGQDTFDLDFTDRFALTSRQKIVWGGGYRFTGESFENTPDVSIEPSSVRLNLFSALSRTNRRYPGEVDVHPGVKMDTTISRASSVSRASACCT